MDPKLLISREVRFSVGRAGHSQVVENPQMHQNHLFALLQNLDDFIVDTQDDVALAVLDCLGPAIAPVGRVLGGQGHDVLALEIHIGKFVVERKIDATSPRFQ